MSSDNEEFYECAYCGFKYALLYTSDYLSSWHCDICDANEYEANDDIYNEITNQKQLKSWLVSECGSRYIPNESKLVKAKALSQLINNTCELSEDPDGAREFMYDMLNYFKFKYKLTKTMNVELDDKFLEKCKKIITNLLYNEE